MRDFKIGLSYSKAVVLLLRLLIGITFVVSGFVKAVDPWGFILKIEEYLSVWGMQVPRTVILVCAIGLSLYEFVCGLMLVLGTYRKAMPRMLMLSMVFMLPLTAYIAVANPVSDCGCFGDFLKLSNWATFWKNVIVVLSLIYLWKFNYKCGWQFIRPSLQWMGIIAASVYIIVIAMVGYLVQPLVDFRDYKVGTYVIDKSQDADDSQDILFVYEKNGESRTFSMDELPDSTWHYVSRMESVHSKNVDRGYLALFDGDEDVTDDVLGEGLQLLIVIPEPERLDISYVYHANILADRVLKEGGEAIGVIAGDQQSKSRWDDVTMSRFESYSADDTALKEMARGSMSVVLIKDGEMIWKRSIASIDNEMLQQLSNSQISILDLSPDDGFLDKLTLWFLIVLTILIGISQIIKYRAGQIQKKNVNLQ